MSNDVVLGYSFLGIIVVLVIALVPAAIVATVLAVLAPEGRAFLRTLGGWVQVGLLSAVLYSLILAPLAPDGQSIGLVLVALLFLLLFTVVRGRAARQ